MRRTFCLAATLLLIATHRLPAPIVETPPEKPTPAAELQEPAKPKARRANAKSSDTPNASKPRAKTEEGSTKEKTGESKPSTPKHSGVARNLTGPRPQYPAEAAAQHLGGTGTYLLHFDQSTGNVTDVTVVQSAGSPILDQASITGFRQWHEDPNSAKEVTMTMTFTMQ
jgi:protein TonB